MEIQLLVDRSEERLTEDQVDALLEIVCQTLPNHIPEEVEEEEEDGEEGGKGLLEARVDESGAAAPCAPSTHPVRPWP